MICILDVGLWRVAFALSTPTGAIVSVTLSALMPPDISVTYEPVQS